MAAGESRSHYSQLRRGSGFYHTAMFLFEAMNVSGNYFFIHKWR